MQAKRACGFSSKACKIGIANAPVFPDPVWARPIISRPVKAQQQIQEFSARNVHETEQKIGELISSRRRNKPARARGMEST